LNVVSKNYFQIWIWGSFGGDGVDCDLTLLRNVADQLLQRSSG